MTGREEEKIILSHSDNSRFKQFVLIYPLLMGMTAGIHYSRQKLLSENSTKMRSRIFISVSKSVPVGRSARPVKGSRNDSELIINADEFKN